MVKIFKSLVLLSIGLFFLTCASQNHVEEYFISHGYTYPVDISGLSVLNTQYANIDKKELLGEGAREFIGSGIIFSRGFFLKKSPDEVVSGAKAFIVSHPVFYRDSSGDIGLMVRTEAYGEGKPDEDVRLDIEQLSADKTLWKAVNFAYFGHDYTFRRWEFRGWVY
jgi:hypothetical protein